MTRTETGDVLLATQRRAGGWRGGEPPLPDATPPSHTRDAGRLVSVVVPCYNEQEVIEQTHRHLVGELAAMPELTFEIVYVDDGSHDGTAEILCGLQQRDDRVRVLRFARNFGHQVAVTAGIDHAAGDAIVIIDADLQDPPATIRDFVACWREGYDVAYGVRVDRPGESRFKLWTAGLFYRLLSRMSDTPIALDTGDFRLISRRVADALREMPERDRFLRGMVGWVGFKQIGVPYRRAPRAAGTSKYPLRKMIRFALDGITSFSIVPLRLAMWVGFASAGVGVLGIVYALVVRLFTRSWVVGWAGIFIAILFMGGVQLITIGIIGEYVGRIYNESKRRPLYVVSERAGFSAERATVDADVAPARGRSL